jgi:alpha-glucosidase (family GH31 glycosyl hydrolase)
MWGLNDPELYSRWFQFACWSTFVRLHSHCNPYEERLPWEVGYEPYSLSKDLLRKRKTMIPYIYSALRAMHHNAVPFMAPVYFYHGSNNMAYNWCD